MATTNNEQLLTLRAGADLSGVDVGAAVGIDNTGRVVAVTTGGALAIGVLAEAGPSAAGEPVLVATFAGTTVLKVLGGATAEEGIPLAVEVTSGRFITATAGDIVLCVSLDPIADGVLSRAIPVSYVLPA
jgi:hypothetical protein